MSNREGYGRYRIIKEIGRGSMGVVYQAHDPQFDRLVALKVLRADRLSGEDFVKRFMKEARAIGRLSHSGIVTAYDVGRDHDTVYLAMEYVEGTPLNELISSRRFAPEDIIRLGVQIGETLDYAHQKGVVHRDIKPANILILPDGAIKIADFGIARIEDPSATFQTQAGEIMGTPAYMSPEQILGKKIDGRSDIFSLGVILYELAAGRRPFGKEGMGLATVFNEIVHHEPPEPLSENPSLPPTLSQTIMKCLSKNPEDRYQTGRDLAVVLGSLDITEDAKVLPEVTVRRSRMKLLLPIVFAVLVCVAAGAYFFLKPSGGTFLQIGSNPSGATIYVDGNLSGKTPARVPVSPGSHEVRIGLEGYQDWAEMVQVPGNKVVPLKAQLNALAKFGFLQVVSDPAGASVFIDGQLQGQTPARIQVPLGEHSLRLTLPGYRDWQNYVQMKEQSDYPVDVRLEREIKLSTVRLASSPPGAQAFLDGQKKGLTPLDITMTPGVHVLKISLEGYTTWEEQINIAEGLEYLREVELSQINVARASLKIESIPQGAEIRVDGVLHGITPKEIELPLGAYMINLSHAGFESWENPLDLTQIKAYPLKVELKPISERAYLSVESSPPGAQVLVDGKRMGKTPLTKLEMPPGNYQVQVSLSGLQDWKGSVRLGANQELPLHIDLQPIPKTASLLVQSIPPGAEVSIDGRRRGNTPLTLKVSLGTHDIRLSLTGYQDWTDRLNLAEAATYPVKAELKPAVKGILVVPGQVRDRQ